MTKNPWLPTLAVAACLLAGCTAMPPATTTGSSQPQFKAVLVAGDASLPVFDNATASVAERLVQRGVAPADITRLSASPALTRQGGMRAATLDRVVAAVGALRPGAGQGCLVFATSHGGEGRGLYLAAFTEFLTPDALDAALARGCGTAPTVVIVSGCYTGSFAQPPMTRPSRVVLTAARPDRASFGCGAGRVYTFYDQCLLRSLAAAATWQQVNGQVQDCVRQLEAGTPFAPSEPQAYFGTQVAGLALPTVATAP